MGRREERSAPSRMADPRRNERRFGASVQRLSSFARRILLRATEDLRPFDRDSHKIDVLIPGKTARYVTAAGKRIGNLLPRLMAENESKAASRRRFSIKVFQVRSTLFPWPMLVT